MKIVSVVIDFTERAPNPDPICDALQVLPGAGSVRVAITTEDGSTGVGESWFGRIAGAPRTLAALCEHVLKPVVMGEDAWLVRGLHDEMLAEVEYQGRGGLASFGISAFDTAIWDALGRSCGLPCWKLWGGVSRALPAYAMVGWLSYAETELMRVCATAVEQGFRAVKVKVGSPTLAEDLERLRYVREAVGEDIGIMVDANQSLTTKEALERGRAFSDAGCIWWEEPIPADDIDGYARLAESLDIPIATGENLYTVADFARFMARDAMDIVQPDLRRVGGPTALLKIGALAEAFRKPYASHASEPAHLNVMATLSNVIYVETGLLSADSPMKLVAGCVRVPQGPGFSWG